MLNKWWPLDIKEIILQTADDWRLIPYGFWSFIPDNPATCHREQHLLGLAWTYLLTDLFQNIMSVCPAACCQADCVSRILLPFRLQIWLKLVSYLLQGDGERTVVIKTANYFPVKMANPSFPSCDVYNKEMCDELVFV